MKNAVFAVPFIFLAAACTNAERTLERTEYLNWRGAELPQNASALAKLRTFSPANTETVQDETSDVDLSSLKPIPPEDMGATRDAVFAHIDQECDKYIDAIFWAARTRKTTTTSVGLAGAATSTILAATGVGTTAIAVTAAAFGLGTGLVDAYYETFLYSLEPSGVVGLIDKARTAYRTSPQLIVPKNEGQLLSQVQGYIRQCSPPTIEALVNAAVKEGEVTTEDKQKTKPLSQAEVDELAKLSGAASLSASEALRLFTLNDRLIRAGISTEPDPAAAPAAPAPDGDGDGAPAPETGKNAFRVPTTRIVE